jgi:multiple sugar transport system substrate-binding protein
MRRKIKMRKTLYILAAMVMTLSMLLAACGPTPTAVVAPTESSAEEPTAAAEEPTAVVEQPTAAPIPNTVQVYWYIGLGTGAQPAQIQPEKDFVAKYNSTQGAKDGIQLVTIIVDNKYARDNLLAQMAAGNAPDIVGPVGTEGRGWIEDKVLDLQPLVDKVGYDLSAVDPAFLKFYKTENGLVGLPFAIYPSALFYNKDLFDQAKLAYPPHKVGEKYKLDGKDVDWDFTTVAAIAKRLTVDSAGVSADQAGFDAKSIAQYGFDFQWTKDSVRWFSAYFEPYYPVKDGKADLSAGQIAAIKWYYDGMWGKEPFIPTQAAMDSDLIKGNSFNSGKVAMGLTHLWYTCCITAPSDAKVTVKNWDVAVVPTYNGKTTAKMHADTFSIMKDSKNPEAAFKVYSYLVGEGAAELLGIYGGLPADKSKQSVFFENQTKTFAPNVVDWTVFTDMIAYLEVPGHELALPNIAKAHDGFLKLGSDLRSNPKLDIDKTIAQFLVDESAIYAEANATPAK